MRFINKYLVIAAGVNQMDEHHLNVRLRELELTQSEHDFLTMEEQAELNFICMKILSTNKTIQDLR